MASPEPLATELIVLVENPDTGRVGAADVTAHRASLSLESGGSAARVMGRRLEPVRLRPDQVDIVFGEALAALPPPPRQFSLHFLFDSDELTEEASTLVPHVLSVVRARAVPEVVVTGHTDAVGGETANVALGLKRAEAVRDLLVGAGVSPALIETQSRGEAVPVVPTADGAPEPRNRRVEVVIR